MGVKVSGVNECVNKLKQMTDDVIARKAARAIQASMIIGASQAALYTPIDTSNLINSQFREMHINGTLITGRVGYTANYAKYVADPNVQMRFRRSTAEKDFLNKGFKDTETIRLDVVKKEMRL